MRTSKRREKRLRILYIVSIMPPYPGGAAVDYSCFLRGFSNGKYAALIDRITVLTEKGCQRDYGSPVIEVRDRLFNYDSAERKRFSRQALNYLMILHAILFARCDVIHIHARYVYARYIGRLIWLALYISRAASVVDIRDRFYNGFGRGPSFLVCSSSLKEYYSWIKGTTLIPVPLSLSPIAKSASGKDIAYFGTIAANKGIMELVEGFKQYVTGKGGMELHIYGANSMGETFTGAIKDVERIKYFGPVPNGEILDRIKGYRAVVLPSKSEGMPRICLETMYCGRIIVCHRNIKSIIPCIPDAYVLEDITPEELKKVFVRLEAEEYGPITYDYDFGIHRQESVCDMLLSHYMSARARAS